ncbi:hypothetical protein Tco_1135600 [Tanacetum coccineum]
MASLDYRLNPLYTIRECSTCGALYNKSCGCSKGGLVDKFVRDPNKTPDSSQRPPILCAKCGNPVEGPSCQGCALWRKKLKEVWFTICHENGIYQDLLNTSESSDDNTNVVNAPQEPFVVKQDPGENSSQSPPQINHNCCYECGDSLDGIFCQRCTCKSCGKGAHIGYNCPPKAPIISNPEPCNQTIDELPQTLPSFDPTCYSEKENSLPYVSKPNFVDDSPNVFNPPPQPPMYSCEFCGNDARYGHYCTPQVPFIYPKPCYNQDFNFPQTLPNFQQQSLCCENYGGLHTTFECQPMNQKFYDSNSFGFDQFQPPQSPVIHQPPQEMSMEALQAREDLMKSIENFLKKFNCFSFRETPKVLMQAWDKFFEIKHAQSEEVQELLYKLLQDLQSINEELAEFIKLPSWNLPTSSYDDDDDEESSIPLKDVIMSELPPCVAITPDSPKTDSLIMVDKHLDTIPEMESDEFIKSSVENFVQNPSKSEDECECDVPDYDDSQTTNFSMFYNPLLDIDDDCTSSDDESFSEEDVPMENFKFFSNPLFDLDEEIIATEFAGELTLLKSIPPGIDNDNLDPEGEIHLVERLLYDNSSPRPPEDSNSDVSDAITESFSPSPIPVEDSDSLMEEIDLFLTPDDSMPPGIENDDYDSEGDILFFEELLTDDSLSLPEHESFHFERDYDPSSPRPPAKPPDDDEIEPDTGLLTAKVVGDIYEHYVFMPRLLPTQPTLCPVIDTLLPFSSENVDKVHLLSHRGFKALQLSSKSPMLIHEDNTPNLGVHHLHFYPLTISSMGGIRSS